MSINQCTHPGCTFPIQNKKYGLCGNHMYEKKNGRSRQEVYVERAQARPVKRYEFKRSKPKQQTKKQATVASALSLLKTDIELKAVQDDMYYCWGCGHSHPGLDKSHILSVGQFKWLELVRENMNLFCRDCHIAWESGDIKRQARLLTFEKDIAFIFDHSEEYFSKIMHKMLDFLKFQSETPDFEAIIMRKIVKKYENIWGK